jgi:hypothetical protein
MPADILKKNTVFKEEDLSGINSIIISTGLSLRGVK